MLAAIPVSSPTKPTRQQPEAHADFLALQPIVERHARIAFRHLPFFEREDAACEAVAAAFVSFVRLKSRGKDPVRDFPSSMATYAVLHVFAGRRAGGHASTTDVMSRQAQRKHGFQVESLSGSCRERKPGPLDLGHGDAIGDALRDNSRTPPDEQAAFRIDFASWLAALGPKDREIIHDLVVGERAEDVAKKFQITSGRISQKRRRFRDDWLSYCDGSQAEDDDRDFAA
jgi:hypothetical protein